MFILICRTVIARAKPEAIQKIALLWIASQARNDENTELT
jgi:hypothetical protein